jgi:uncharacterized membrane protein YheB (UPF0754 family)
MNYWLLIIPVLSAFIGWVTNKILLKMLFHPRVPVKFIGISFQGIYPKKQQQMAEKLGKLASAEFLSSMDLEKNISDPGNLQKVMPLIEKHVDDFLRIKLKEEIPVVSMFIGDKTIGSLKKVFMQEIAILFPEIMKQFAGNLKSELDLEKIVTQKIMDLSPGKLEKELYEGLSTELRWVGIIGAIIGFIIGLLQVGLILLTSS